MYSVINSALGAVHSAGHTLWCALALCRDLNLRGRTPGRYIVRKAGA